MSASLTSGLTRRQCCARLMTLTGALAFGGCATISPQEQQRLGRQEADEVERAVGLVRDRALVEYIEAIGTRLAQATGRSDVTWQWAVVDDAELDRFEPATTVLMDAPPEADIWPRLPAGRPFPSYTRVLTAGPNSLELDVTAENAGMLVLAEAWFPGWRAWVVEGGLSGFGGGAAEVEVPVYRADGMLRAVPVPAGRSTVRLEYSPTSLRVGAYASFLGASEITSTDRLRFLHAYLAAGTGSQEGWKSWWKMVSRATAAKVAKNRRNGRTLG